MEPADERYELNERIGAGGMAEVYRAQMLGAAGFKKVVAVKRILPDLCTDKNFVDRFIDEARLTARLLHPNICQVYDFGVLRGSYFIAMEFVEGLDLHRVLSYLDRQGERLPVGTALRITAELLRGLGFAHRATDEQGRPLNIVHRDVSPHNVLLASTGGVKVGDFGCATAIAEMRLARTQANTTYGKLIYMSPEQIAGTAPDQRADIFSVGVVLSEMLQGTRGFRRSVEECIAERQRLVQPSVSELPPELQTGIARVLELSLHQDADGRYAEASHMVDDIEGCLAALPHGSTADLVSNLVVRFQSERSSPQRLPSSASRGPAVPSSPWSASVASAPPAELGDGTSQLGSGDVLFDGDGTAQLDSGEIMLLDEGGAAGPAAGAPRVVIGGGGPSADELTTNVRGGGAPHDGAPSWDELAYDETAHHETGPRDVGPGASDLLRGEAATRAYGGPSGAGDDAATRAFTSGSQNHSVGPSPARAAPSVDEELQTRAYESGSKALEELQTRAYESGSSEVASAATRAYVPDSRGPDHQPPAPSVAAAVGPVPAPRPSPAAVAEEPPREAPPEESGEQLPYSVRMAKQRYGAEAVRNVSRVTYTDRPDKREGRAEAGPSRYDRTEVVRTKEQARSFRTALIVVGLMTAVLVVMAAVVFVFEVDLRNRAAALLGWGGDEGLHFPLPLDGGAGGALSGDAGVRDGAPRESGAGDADAGQGATRPDPPRRAGQRPGPRSPAPEESVESSPPPAPARIGASARLTVTSSVSGRVYVGGRLVSVQTPATAVELPPGSHEVRIVFSDGSGEQRRRVTVVSGQHHMVRFGR